MSLYARLLELPDLPVADWTRIPNDGELFQDGSDVYMGDGTTAASGLTPISGGGGGGAPTNAQYLTLALNGSLSAERVLVVGTGLSLTDGGANGNATLAATGVGSVDFISGHIETAADKTYYLDQYAMAAYTINEIRIISASGTVTAAVKIDGTNVTGISAVAVSSSEATGTASAANSVSVGNTVTLVLSSNAAALDVRFTLKITRA
jgi:hypothetical protein